MVELDFNSGDKKENESENHSYPRDSILSEMLIDIYASKKRDDIWIMHDKDFSSALVKLEFEPQTGKLTFIFEDGKRDLGAPIRQALKTPFTKVKEITFYLMDVATKKIHKQTTVPVTLTGKE
jgi:hypothetical protein